MLNVVPYAATAQSRSDDKFTLNVNFLFLMYLNMTLKTRSESTFRVGNKLYSNF